MTQLRNRLVIDQDGQRTVSGALLAADEIWPTLDVEETLHRATGWHVTRYGACLRMQRGDTVRWVWVRSKPPLEDVL